MKTFWIYGAIFVLIGFGSGTLLAQDDQSIFLNGKQYLNQGNYDLAIASFKKLADPNAKHAFKEYASFYYALSAYKNSQLGLARSMWLQIVDKYPNWDRMSDVHYWLAQVYFEEKNTTQATYYAKKSDLPEVRGLLKHHLALVEDLETLVFLNEQYPEDKEIAYALSKKISESRMNSRNFILLTRLVDQFEFNKAELGMPEIGNSKLKEEYNVAVLFPFMFDGLDDIRRISRNRFVLDLYEGLLEGADFVNRNGSKMKIWPYDTRRKKDLTQKILSRPEMKSMDLIIGPLFPDPSELTSKFCYDNKINMINPVSSNSRVIENNPFSFLFKPSNEQQAIAASEFVFDKIENRNAIIFYNNAEQDSITSAIYKQRIVEKGFDVIHHLPLIDSTIYLAKDMLTEIYEDTLSTSEADSIRLIKGRIVKERKPRDEDGRITYEKDSVEYYEEHLVISPDSIGHIFVASSNPLHAANIMSAIEIRKDTIPIVGRGNWVNFETLTTKDLEDLRIIFIDPDFIDIDKQSYNDFRSEFRMKYKKEPSLNHSIGYELMVYTGSLMQKFGHYFQKGGMATGMNDGKIFYGINLGASNSNEVVPITRFINTKLEVINFSE